MRERKRGRDDGMLPRDYPPPARSIVPPRRDPATGAANLIALSVVSPLSLSSSVDSVDFQTAAISRRET